jgi:sphinganine-1-phosphate aldolase
MIAATSAHAAVDKGCDMLGVRLIKVPMDPDTYTISVAAVRKALSPNTILIYASAPSYPQGTIDPVKKLGKIAASHDVGLHVDCCLGGFVLPFAKKLGYNIPGNDLYCIIHVYNVRLCVYCTHMML